MRKKNRKVRRLRELYPDLRIKLFYARDFRALMLKYWRSALVSELSGTLGQVMPNPDEDGSLDSEGRLEGLDRVGGPSGGADRGNPDLDGGQRPHYERRSRGARRRAVRRAAAAAAHTPATT